MPDWFKTQKAKTLDMRLLLTILAFLASMLLIQFASADVWIPEDEYLGYFDSQGVYTVVGAVKNTENHAVVPTITIILDGAKQIRIEQQLPTVFPNKDIPFKIPIPNVSNDVVLRKPAVIFEKDTDTKQSDVVVIYNSSLKRHRDGHLTGKIINNGNATEYDVKVYATIHGQGNIFLDVGKNIEKIEKIEPGQIIDFTMYPESSIASEIKYYSCFAIGDETVIPLYTVRSGKEFGFRYDSTASFTAMGFDESGTKLSLAGINSFKVPTFVSFEFPMTSEKEKFDVTVDEKPVKSIQSIDDDGNWHVAFDVDGASQSRILITGFENPETSYVQNAMPSFQDYSFLYYVVPVVAAIGAGAYLYRRKKPKLAD
ncbi:MAG: peptidase [Candidatus Nitrosotenuis sp.]